MNSRNDHLVCIVGKSGTGKSASLRDLLQPEGVYYFNTEAGKRLPFKSKFKEFVITDPKQIYQGFDKANTLPDVHTIVIDSLVFMMDMYESVHVLGSANTMQAWGEYAQFFKNLMNQYVAATQKNVIFTSHVMDILNEKEMAMETMIKVKGSLMNTGIEAFFSTVVATKKMPLKVLKDYENDLLDITAEDEMLGFKNVFQTRLTKETVNERIRAPLGMWEINETYIDNNAQNLMGRLHEYYS